MYFLAQRPTQHRLTRRSAARTRTQAAKTSGRTPRTDAARETNEQAIATLVKAKQRAIGLAGAALVSFVTLLSPPDAEALLASPRRDLPRTPDAALRRSIPSFNEHIASLQGELESVQYLLRIPQRKPWQNMATSAATAARLAADGDSCLRGVLPSNMKSGEVLLEEIRSDLTRLERAIDVKDPERTSIRVANALERLGQLELLQSPGLKYQLPDRYSALPRLTGRATLEMTLSLQSGGATTLELTLDGFSAPLTSGRVLSNVLQKKYDGSVIRVDETSIFADFRDPRGAASAGPDRPDPLPLEILAKGDFEPTYRFSLDVNNSDEIPVLPLSIDGALAMTRAGEGLSSSSEFFIFKYNRQQAGLSGLSFDEGNFSVFGYVTKNQEALRQLSDGDRINRIKVISGEEKLVNGRVDDAGASD